ncbi:hypothetical protein [Streptomyces sp. NPDC047108]|uniref:hypothetical protein n=1 Tax=Streptomyces sp. NPDC047108 TaxID=3155025 RepID=UPI0033C88194
MPTLVIDGGDSPPWLREASRAIAAATPGRAAPHVGGPDARRVARGAGPVLRDYFA